MRTRFSLLVVTLGIALVAVACGRASRSDIDSALHITPTMTLSADQIATGTAEAVVAQQTSAAAAASPGANELDLAVLNGDIVQGTTQYMLRCLNCHQASGKGRAPALSGPANPAVALSNQQLVDLVRTGQGHASPPGPLSAVAIPDRQLVNIIAYIRSISK